MFDPWATTEMKILRLMEGNKKRDRTRNECICNKLEFAPTEDNMSMNQVKQLMGHVQMEAK